MLHRIIKRLSPILVLLMRKYLSKPRKYSYKGIKITVQPGVFYPGFMFSTKILLDFIDRLELKGKKFLEMGAGSGIISLLAARKGARVTASDINPVAVEAIIENARRNSLKVNCSVSDLFDTISENEFDYIIINPPYYPGDPGNFSDMAWFCGKDFEFFKRLFSQMKDHFYTTTIVDMILSEDCDLDRIRSIAAVQGFTFEEIHRKKRFGEWNYIYRIGRNTF